MGRISHSPSVHELLYETQSRVMEGAAPVMRRVKTFVGTLESYTAMEVPSQLPLSSCVGSFSAYSLTIQGFYSSKKGSSQGTATHVC